MFESGFYTVLSIWAPLSSCLLLLFQSPFLWEMSCHRCKPGREAESCTKPWAVNVSVFCCCYFCYRTHFYPLIWNSTGGTAVLSVSPSSEWWYNHLPQMEDTTECLYQPTPSPQGVIHLSLQPECPWSPLVHLWRLVFVPPEGSGNLSDDFRAASGIPFLWPLWIAQHYNLTFCPDGLVSWNDLLYVHLFASVV